MPRPPRVSVEGALDCVTSRAMEGLQLFRDDRDYTAYLDLLNEYQAKFGFTLFAFSLLPHQIALCLELAPGTTISEIMHDLTSRYTKIYNKRYGHAGHLFQERFKSTLMEKAPSLLRATVYLHLAPRYAGAVEDIRVYRWSSLSAYLAAPGSAEPILRGGVQEVLGRLAIEQPGVSYDTYLSGVTHQAWEKADREFQQWVVGSVAFVESVKRRAAAQRAQMSEAAVPTPTISGPAPQPQPQPRPRGFQPRPAPMLTGSLAIAAVALCAAILYAKNLAAVRQTMQSLARERSSLQAAIGQAPVANATSAAQLATLHQAPSRLNGTSWQLQILPTTGPAQGVQADSLEFRDGTVMSQLLSAHGFSPSNYTLTLEPDGTVVWQTMQTDQTRTVVCWRGEWRGTRMHGVMTQERPGAMTTTFNFIGTLDASRDAMHPATSEI